MQKIDDKKSQTCQKNPPVAFPVKLDIITSNTKRSQDVKNKDINRPTGATQIYFVC